MKNAEPGPAPAGSAPEPGALPGPGVTARRIALGYVGFASLWILGSDSLVEVLVPPQARLAAQSFKGLAFVLLTGVLLFLLIRRDASARSAVEHRLRRLTRLHSILRGAPEAYLHGRSCQEIVQAALDAAAGNGAYTAAWSVRFGEDGRPDLLTVSGVRPDTLPGCSRVGGTPTNSCMMTSLRAGAPSLVIADVPDHPCSACAARLANAGVRSIAAFPISTGLPGGGLVAFGSSSASAFDRDEVAVLEQFARQLGVVIGRRLLEEQKAELEGLLATAEAMASLGQLTGSVMHDFNNIVTAVRSASEVAMMDVGPASPAGEMLAQINLATDKAEALTRQLLSLAHPRPAEVLDLRTVVRGFEPILLRCIGSRIRLELDLPGDAVTVRAVRVALEQVLLNLVVNARDAISDRGLVTVGVAASGSTATLSVADTGSGIPPAILHRIFEPNFTTKAPGKGTGIGLSTVRRIARESGGDVDVESRVGSGSTFTVRLPLIMAAAPVLG